jgi:hypothetical protein
MTRSLSNHDERQYIATGNSTSVKANKATTIRRLHINNNEGDNDDYKNLLPPKS